jgi:hypothetical protein
LAPALDAFPRSSSRQRVRFLGKLLRVPVGIHRLFESLLAQFVSGHVIPFTVGGGSGSVGMLRQVVKFRSSIMGTLGHCVLLRLFDANKTNPAMGNTEEQCRKDLGPHRPRVSAQQMEPKESILSKAPLACQAPAESR